MAEAKTKRTRDSVDDFLNKVKPETKREDCLQLRVWMTEVTGEAASIWGSNIVGFGAYRYVYESGRTGDWPIIGFSPRAQNITVYIMPGFASFESELSQLGKHSLGKSCLYIKRLSDIDAKVLQQILKKAVRLMASKRVKVTE